MPTARFPDDPVTRPQPIVEEDEDHEAARQEAEDDYHDYLKSQKASRDRRRRSTFVSLENTGSHHAATPIRRGGGRRNNPMASEPSFRHQIAPSFRHHHHQPAVVGGLSTRNLMGPPGSNHNHNNNNGSNHRAPNNRTIRNRRQTLHALQVLGMREGSQSGEWHNVLHPTGSSHHAPSHGRTASRLGLVDEDDPEHEPSFHEGSDHLHKSHHDHGDERSHSHHQLMLPFYCSPVQRQLWEDDQVLPHVNWHDLFFDLIFVAAAYNLGAMLITAMTEDDWPRGVVYFVGMFGPLYSIWENDVVYASRYTLVDYSHRLAAVVRFLCVSFAVLSIKPLHQLGDKHSAETFVFCLSLFSESLVQLLLNLELYLWGDGDRKAIQNQTKRETLCHILPSSLTYLAATLLAGYSLFYTEKPPPKNGYGDTYGDGYESSSSSGNSTSDYYGNSTTTTEDRHNDYRFLAGESDYGSSSDDAEDGVNWNVADVPLMLCLGAYVFNILLCLFMRSTHNKNSHDIREYFVPNNIDYMIHRYGEWIMLMIGESILSLLIVEIVEAQEYYLITLLGCLTVIILQMLKFESQPAHADGHALWRSMTAATIFSVLIQVISMALVAFGVSYKLMLKYVLKDNDPKNDSSDSYDEAADTTTNAYGTEDAYGADADAAYGTRRLAGVSVYVTSEANAWLFCISLTVVLICLELMMTTHRGIAETFNLLYKSPEGAPHQKSINYPIVFVSILKLGILGFTATLATWLTTPLDIAIAGFLVVFTMAFIRIVAWGFTHHEELMNDAISEVGQSVRNALTMSTLQKPDPAQIMDPLPDNTEQTAASVESNPKTAKKNIGVRNPPKLLGNHSELTPISDIEEFAPPQKQRKQKQEAPKEQSKPRKQHSSGSRQQRQEQAPDEQSKGSKQHPRDTLQTIWFEYTDPESGDNYYADKIGNTTWEKPIKGKIIQENRPKATETKPVAKTSSKSNSSSSKSKSLPAGWSSHTDSETGEKYYMGPTGATQWDPPPNQNFIKVKDRRKNKTREPKLPKGWLALMDPDSGDSYYYNEKTGQSTWDRPSPSS